MKKIFKGINLVLSVVLVFIAVGVAYVAFPQFGNKALIVRSGSMTPTIGVGSIVVARPVDNAVYKKGDIIAFRSEKNSKTIITHRVTDVEMGPGGISYKTKGDANEEVDGWSVSEKNVLGKVGLTIPYAGRVLTFAKSDIGFPTLIILPAIIVIVIELISIIKEVKKQKRPHKEDLPFGFRLHPGGGFTFAPQDKSKLHLTGFKILIPLLILAIAVPGTLAVMKDSETSVGNLIQASNIFPNQSISPTPTVIPSATPTLSPTPTIEPSITPTITP